MNAYAYQASLYCTRCIKPIIADLSDSNSEDTGDSNDYPQGPIADGGGEADCPQACAGCLIFMENPLTDNGLEFVRRSVRRANPLRPCMAIRDWVKYYDLCECSAIAGQIKSGDAVECVFCHYKHTMLDCRE
jgi:hypothetical protein